MSFWSNCLNKFRAIAAGAALVALWSAASPASAQDQQQPQILSGQQLQQLVAPVALYPDPLLAQILTASTYPLEVVIAARWSKDNPDLKGQDLENAMQQQPWDPSVKGLTAVPQVLAMMNDKLDWTQQLGEAFLAQPDDITKAVQALRAKAESTGNLKTTKEQRVRRVAAPPPSAGEVVVVPEYIAIEPFEPEVIYVPVYDPVVIFGVGYWPPAFVPFFWYPPWWTVGPVWGFWPAYYVGPALWCQYNWGFGYVQINVVQFNKFNHTHLVSAAAITKWQHDPQHHAGVPYKHTGLQQKYGKASTLGGGPKSGGPKLGGPGGPKGGTKTLSSTSGGGGPGHKPGGSGPKGGTKTLSSTSGGGGTGHKPGGSGPKGGTKTLSSSGGGGGTSHKPSGGGGSGPKGGKTFTSSGGGGGGGGGFKSGGPKGGSGGGGGATSFRSVGAGGGGGGGAGPKAGGAGGAGPKAGGGGGGGGAPPRKHP